MKSLSEILKQTGLPSATARARSDDLTPLPPEAPDDDEACPECGGAGFVRKAVHLGHPDFGRAFPCACVENENEGDRNERLLRYSGLGALSRLTFENLSPRGRSPNPQHQEAFAKALAAATEFAARPFGWLLLTGPSGCGKTHLAAAIAGRCIEQGQAALFMVVPDLLDHLRAAYQPGSEVGYDELFEMVRNAPVLVLDDLGVQSSTPWAEEKLFQLINHRYGAQLPTLITTNLDPAHFDSRLQTRLTDVALSQVHSLEPGGAAAAEEVDALALPLLKGMTFKSFDPQIAANDPRELRDLQAIHREAMKYADAPANWLVIAGPTGKGKTRIAAAIGNFCREAGRDVLFAVVPDLLDTLRAAYDPQNPASFDVLFERVRTAAVLILDDLGAQSGTPWAEEKLFQLINYRYNACLPTVFTTNATKRDLESRVLTRLLDPQISTIMQVGDFNVLGDVAPLRQPAPTRGRPRTRN